jgi:hypothetical protein
MSSSSSSARKPRGNPNFLLKRAKREGVDVNELVKQQLQHQQGAKASKTYTSVFMSTRFKHIFVLFTVVMKPYEAAHVLDKNSRTMVKILQLLVCLEHLPQSAS